MGIIVVLAGCGQQREPGAQELREPEVTVQAPQQASIHRGMLRLNAPYTFKPCGGTDVLPATGAEIAKVPKDLAPDSSATLFTIIRGTRGDSMRGEKVLYAMGEGYECYTDWTAFEARALGNEPGWVVEVKSGALKLQRQGGFTAEWGELKRDSSATGVRYTSEHPQNGTITVLLQPQTCRDGMSGAYYQWSAELVIGAETLKGCGIRL